MELIFNCSNFLCITDIISNDISNKKFITYNNYDHTHYFCNWSQFKKDNKKHIFEKYFDLNDKKYVAKLVKKKVLIGTYPNTITLFSRLFKPKCGSNFYMQVFLLKNLKL